MFYEHRDAAAEQHKKNLAIIETAAQRASDVGCGVIVYQQPDGSVRAVLDPFAPPKTINLIEVE